MTSTALSPQAYLAHLRDESVRFAEAIAAAPAGRKVPTCPDWTREDLLWHLAGVQFFWASVVRERITDGAVADGVDLHRPADEGLPPLFRRASAELVRVLGNTAPTTPVWTWWDPDRTAGFVLRRQTHEALIHRVDAELLADDRTPLDPQLAADGVDEAVRIMYSPPPWGAFEPVGELRLRCRDTGHSWLVRAGRCTGTDPDSGESLDEMLIVTAEDDGRTPAAAVEGAAADLDCLLWNRPPLGPVERSGDPDALAALDAVLSSGVQ